MNSFKLSDFLSESICENTEEDLTTQRSVEPTIKQIPPERLMTDREKDCGKRGQRRCFGCMQQPHKSLTVQTGFSERRGVSPPAGSEAGRQSEALCLLCVCLATCFHV